MGSRCSGTVVVAAAAACLAGAVGEVNLRFRGSHFRSERQECCLAKGAVGCRSKCVKGQDHVAKGFTC